MFIHKWNSNRNANEDNNSGRNTNKENDNSNILMNK